MRLTKSLFVEYTTNPHLARWHVHDKNGVYAKILDKMYGDMDGLAIGNAVEERALALFQ